jgi:5-methylcytosine-specific restriction endonuclease McrA
MSELLRNPENDVRKSAAKLKEQFEKKLCCTLDGCTQPLTTYKGPGDSKLCREHQIQQREYGGLGRVDRPWSFSREWSCAWCGYSPKDDPWFDNPPIPFDNEIHKSRVMRSTLIGDHEERKVEGGGHTKDNVQTLCRTCDGKKTALYKDYQKTSTEVEIDSTRQ